MSATVTENWYCWSLLGLETTVTVDVCYSYKELLLLVNAGVGDHCYSGCLGVGDLWLNPLELKH